MVSFGFAGFFPPFDPFVIDGVACAAGVGAFSGEGGSAPGGRSPRSGGVSAMAETKAVVPGLDLSSRKLWPSRPRPIGPELLNELIGPEVFIALCIVLSRRQRARVSTGCSTMGVPATRLVTA